MLIVAILFTLNDRFTKSEIYILKNCFAKVYYIYCKEKFYMDYWTSSKTDKSIIKQLNWLLLNNGKFIKNELQLSSCL